MKVFIRNNKKNGLKKPLAYVIKNLCPKCGSDYTYEIGYGFKECPRCSDVWKIK